jgi:hypothetical protein
MKLLNGIRDRGDGSVTQKELDDNALSRSICQRSLTLIARRAVQSYHLVACAADSSSHIGGSTVVENGQTDDSADNARLVSPSFMIASQLGVTQSAGSISDSSYARAVNQCKNYVETYYDDLNNNNKWDSGETVHHYRDWRLPTAEEIRIIAELQGKANGAVDTVLAGKYYFCASPQKYVKGAGSGTDYYFIRCIRDAY